MLESLLLGGVFVAGSLLAAQLHGTTAPGHSGPGAIDQEGGYWPSTAYTWRTVYIVGSEAEASSLRDGLSSGNSIRNGLGLAPLIDEVIVAESRADAAHIEAALQEGILILASFGVEDRVVNLVV